MWRISDTPSYFKYIHSIDTQSNFYGVLLATMRILLSGFEPGFGIKKNPSEELAKLWSAGEVSVENVDVKAAVLPQLFGKSADILWSDIVAWKPHSVLMFGATQHNDPIRLERFALNVEKTLMGDNTRIPVKERPAVHSGPLAYECSLPVHWLVEKLGESGIDAKPSYHAGTSIYNSIFYNIMHKLSCHPIEHPVGVGFIYVPTPSEFGVVEDGMRPASTFPGIVKASMVLVKQVRNWYLSKHGNLP